MNTMGPSTSTPGRALPALLAAAVVSIVLGIIGMHALNTHGVAGTTEHAAMTAPITGSMLGSHADMTGGPAVHDPGGVTATGSSAVPDGDNNSRMGSMVMLCFAMLAAAGVLLLLILGLRRIPRVWAHLPAAPTAVTGWVTARLGTGPPAVWEFSVIRC